MGGIEENLSNLFQCPTYFSIMFPVAEFIVPDWGI